MASPRSTPPPHQELRSTASQKDYARLSERYDTFLKEALRQSDSPQTPEALMRSIAGPVF